MELEDIKGIGLKTVKNLNTLGIYNINDLVSYYPYRYQVYNIKKLSEIDNDENCVVIAKIETEPRSFFIRKNFNRLSFKALSDNTLINVTIFNRAYLKN